MSIIRNIFAYLEARNRETCTRGDDIAGFVCDGITQQLDNSTSRLLMGYLENGEDKKAADLLRDCFAREYFQNAEAWSKIRQPTIQMHYMRYDRESGMPIYGDI